MRIRTKNYWLYLTIEGWFGFGYVIYKGHESRRFLWFLGFLCIEGIDRRVYPNDKGFWIYTMSFPKKEHDGKWEGWL